MYEQHATSVSSHGHRSTISAGKAMDRPYLVRRSHSTPCSESDNNLDVHGGSSSSSNAPVTRSQSNKRIIPPYSNRSLASSPPTTPNKLGSTGKLNQNNKLIGLKIILLDDSVTIIQAQSKALGRVVFDQVCKQLNVLESDYFGLEYTPTHSQSQTSTAPSSPPPLSTSSSILNSSSLISTSATTPTHVQRQTFLYWLDLEKRLTRQVAFNTNDPVLRFSVKFYTPDPSQLEEEFTRYLFSLQIKRDLQLGTLVCNDNTAALMASYIVQAECGDWSEQDYPDSSYLSMYKFIPHQDYEIERKIRENHKKHIGQSPAEADLHLLETARRTELYGIKMHPARDEDGVSLNLSVCHNGLLVFQNFVKINTFSWAKIRKLSFKRKRFILKLHPEISDGYYKDLVEFIFDSRNDCKAYWKRCVEHHAFFRCEKAPNPIHRSKGLLSSRGSSFRYSGRTQKQMVQFVRENFVKRPAPGGGAVPVAAGGNAGVLVPDVSSSDNNSFDNSIVSGERGDGGRGSGRFQRSSSLRSAASQQQPQPQIIPQQEYPNTLSKSLSTIAGSKNYEEDTIIYTTRAEVAAAQRAAAAAPVPVARDWDWFFYLSKELSHVFTTYLKDLRLLKNLLATQQKSEVLPQNLVIQTENLTISINNLMRDRELFEDKRHGLEIISLCLRYFQSNENVYLDYVGKLEELFLELDEDYSAYLPVEAVVTRPILLCQYYLERICFECRCCGAGELNCGSSAQGLRKVNFSPVLDKRSFKKEPGDMSLDPPLLQKLHTTHLLLNKILEPYHKIKLSLLSIAKVQELTREMDGFANVAGSGSKKQDVLGLLSLTGQFIRQGILLKLNKRKGLQNRIFFLFTHTLVYGTRLSSTQGFRLHGVISTRNMELLDTSLSSIPNSFSIVVKSDSGVGSSEALDGINEKILILAAFSVNDHDEWVKSVRTAICGSLGSDSNEKIVSRLFNSSEELLNNNVNRSNEVISASVCHNRSNAISHVCWHRNISISALEISDKERFCLSGPVLRKFKNSPGWQKLWITFAHSCLYFYKSANETTPLASLPLLGYKIELLTEEEKSQVNKENVFKLAFKAHVYYFRAESSYTFKRWIATLRNAMIGDVNTAQFDDNQHK